MMPPPHLEELEELFTAMFKDLKDVRREQGLLIVEGGTHILEFNPASPLIYTTMDKQVSNISERSCMDLYTFF